MLFPTVSGTSLEGTRWDLPGQFRPGMNLALLGFWDWQQPMLDSWLAAAAELDGIDLSVRPMASGTVQPDVRSMWHALKGTGYSLDVDETKMDEIENLLNEGMKEYDFNPVTTTADARVVGFPMPGGAIGPNVHMMKEAGILHKYSEVLAEFPVVVKAGGAWTSVTPGSQQYFLQAFNNVLLGRWKKMNDGYGLAVLGYFGKPPLTPDPEVVKVAAEQLGKEPFDGDPLEAAPDSLAEAETALKERDIELTDENVFLVAAACKPGKAIELNEGIRLLTGKAKIVLPLKKEEKPEPEVAAAPAAVHTGHARGACWPSHSCSCCQRQTGNRGPDGQAKQRFDELTTLHDPLLTPED